MFKANPGKFTYPAPPDFTGYAFVLTVCYDVLGGPDKYLVEFDQELMDTDWQACWDLLNEIEPYLWREGQYPETLADLDNEYANSGVYMTMHWNPAKSSSLIEDGTFPDTTRTFVFDGGTPANTHYLAIPYNAANRAGAMVVADFIISAEAQLSKRDILNWGDLEAIVVANAPQEIQDGFAALPSGIATLPDEELVSKRVNELSGAWREALEAGWTANVLEK